MTYMLHALMQVSINGPNIVEGGAVIKTAVKIWMPNRKKLSKGKPIANEVPTTATVVRLDEPEDTSDDSEVFTAVSEELQLPSEGEVNQTEVISVIEALKLTQDL